MRRRITDGYARVSQGLGDGSLAAVFARGVSVNTLTLVANLASGVVIARALGPSGRGELAAIVAIANVPFMLSVGCQRAIAFHQARHPGDAGRLLSTWLLLLAPVVLVGIAVLELLVSVFLAQQTADTQALARVWIATSVVLMLSRVPLGILLGDHEFSFFYLIGILQPVAIAVGYALLAAAGLLSVAAALIVSGLAFALGTIGAFVRAISRYGLARPSVQLARTTGLYALRAEGSALGAGINARLDLLIIPAYVSATSVGFYSVATNVSWIVFNLAGALALVVLPTAARNARRHSPGGPETVIASLYVTVGLASVVGIVIGVLGSPAIALVYGNDFLGAVVPLQILLGAAVLYSAAHVLLAGLDASNRPLLAAGAEVSGALLTIVGLLLVLPSRGITGAAVVSLVSYATVLICAAVLYRTMCTDSWAAFRPQRGLLRRLRAPLSEQGSQAEAPA